MSELESMARALEEHEDYRVLRRFRPREHYAEPAAEPVRRAVYVDVETTGFELGRDRIIELAMVSFEYDAQGCVTRVLDTFDELEDPGRPIPAPVTRLTGIRDEDVAGRTIDEAAVGAALEEAQLVIAHNARFDRPFLERRFPAFEGKPFACSLREVPWREEGLESGKLEFLAYRFGLFFDGHRALEDCQVGVHLLAQPLPQSGEPALKMLLASARRSELLIRAIGSPFETKDLLKARRYTWLAAERTWCRSVPEEEAEAELAWLEENVYAGPSRATTARVTAFQRYSPREWAGGG